MKTVNQTPTQKKAHTEHRPRLQKNATWSLIYDQQRSQFGSFSEPAHARREKVVEKQKKNFILNITVGWI